MDTFVYDSHSSSFKKNETCIERFYNPLVTQACNNNTLVFI